MAPKGKVIIILLILLCCAAIILSGIIYISLEKEKEKNKSLLEKISNLESKKEELERKIEDYTLRLSKTDEKLDKNEEKIRELTFLLDKEKEEKKEVLLQLSSLKETLDKLKKENRELEKKIAQKVKEIGSLKVEVERLEKAKEQLAKKIKEISSGSEVELGKIVVAQEEIGSSEIMQDFSQETSDKQLEGKILVVNKEYSFAVINLGLRDGVSSGDRFSVYRKNKYIGDVVVERVDEGMSSVNFVNPQVKDAVREGDRVITTLP
jgi:predicted RNase H-like nuclease (RuvC/YqgF family)